MIVIYGADWCRDCMRVKRYFDTNNIPYKFRDIQQEPELITEIVEQNKKMGRGPVKSIPVIFIDKKKVLIEPSNEELEEALMIK